MPYRHKTIGLLGTGIHHGQPKPGVEKAYSTLANLGLFDKLSQQGVPITNYGDLAAKGETSDPYGRLFEKTKVLMNEEITPLLIGGDHSQAFATVSAILHFYPDLKVLWIDAHGDINTPDSSPSGNLHGMPLSGLLGVVDKTRFNMPWLQQSLKPENVALIGIRDLDQGEMDLIQSKGVIHYTIDRVRELGIDTVLDEVYKTWGDGQPVHLSFDIDGLDSSLVPATGTPVGNGLNLHDMTSLIARIRQMFHIVSCEVVEFNPDLAKNSEELKTTQKTVTDIITKLLT